MDKRLFIHIPKNAGMTIRKSDALKGKFIVATRNNHKSHEYSESLLKLMNSLGDHHGYEHARLRDINPILINKHQPFAVIRNPWDRVASRYFFAKKLIEKEKKIKASYADISSFEAFLEERFKWGNKEYMWHRAVRGWYPALDYVVNDAGVISCDMMRFENLDEDLCAYFKIDKMSRRRNVTNKKNSSYMAIYTDKTIQIVADWYQSDIDAFGHDFNSGCKRNYWNVGTDTE